MLAALLFVTLPFVVRTVQPVLLELDREMEQAAASLGAGNLTIFRRIILPNLVPAILAGTALSFARALGEYGSTVFISGSIPFETQVASVHIYSQVENDNLAGAAAVATVLLVVSLLVLVGSASSSDGRPAVPDSTVTHRRPPRRPRAPARRHRAVAAAHQPRRPLGPAPGGPRLPGAAAHHPRGARVLATFENGFGPFWEGLTRRGGRARPAGHRWRCRSSPWPSTRCSA